MDESPIPPPSPDNSDRLVRAIRNLTIAVSCVAAGVLLLVAMTFYSYARFYWRASRAAASDSKSLAASKSVNFPSSDQPQRFEGKDFNELTNEKQIKYASAILLTKWVKSPRQKTRAIVSEIVKHKPGTELHFKVGDEYPTYGRPDSECAGDGEVVLMVDSPAQMRSSSSYTGDRLDSLGMTLAELREAAKQ